MSEDKKPEHHILKLLKHLGDMNISQFEKETKIGASTIDKAVKRGSHLGFGTVQKIKMRYPEVSEKWLETGTGPMLEKKAKIVKGEVKVLGSKVPMRLNDQEFNDAFPDWEGLPMYNTPITASFVATYRDEGGYTPQYYLRDPRFRDCDFGAIITGDSMHSEIRHGDFIACKEVTDTRFIVFGDIYYVVATNGLETCKYLNYDKTTDNLVLVAKNDKIPPSPLPKDMLLKLYKVRGIVRGY